MEEVKDTQGELWEVFVQVKPGKPFRHVGSVHGYDKQMAMENARDLYTRREEGKALWIVKASDIVASQPEDEGAFFDPANDKVYRHPTFYELPEGAKYI